MPKHVDNFLPTGGKGRHASVVRCVFELARHQHSTVSRRQLLGVGLTTGEIDGLLARGLMGPIFAGVYVVGPAPRTLLTRSMAGTLAHDPSLLSHRSSTEHLGLTDPIDGSVHILKSGTRPRGQPGLIVHRTTLPWEPICHVHAGIPIVAPMLAILQRAAGLGPRGITAMLDRSEAKRLLDIPALDHFLAAHPNAKRRRCLLEAMVPFRPALPDTASSLETRFLRACRTRRLFPATGVPIDRYEVDFYWPEARLIVETDGFKPHRSRTSFDRDRAKWARLTSLGFPLILVTDHRLSTDANSLFDEIFAVLARAAAA